jgi:hypothetical protein
LGEIGKIQNFHDAALVEFEFAAFLARMALFRHAEGLRRLLVMFFNGGFSDFKERLLHSLVFLIKTHRDLIQL